MSIRSAMLALAISTVGVTSAAAAPLEKTTNTAGDFVCANGVGVLSCVGTISIFPININVHDVDALSNNDLDILENSLNNLRILDGGILNHLSILNHSEVTVLQYFLNHLAVVVAHNDVDVCTNVLGLICI